MPRLVAMRARADGELLLLRNHLSGDDTRRDRQHRVTQEHHESREETSQTRHRCDITIPHRRGGHNRPIDTARNIMETTLLDAPLDHVHHRANADNEQKHKDKEHNDFAETGAQGVQQDLTLPPIGEELKDAEDSDQAQDTDGQQAMCVREDKAQIGSYKASTDTLS